MDTILSKNSKHVRFDEGINDIEIPSPNSRQLWMDLSRILPEDQEDEPIIMPQTLCNQQTPLTMIHDVQVKVIYDHDTLWMIIDYFPARDRVNIKDTTPRKSCSLIKGWKINLGGLTWSK